MLVRVEIRSHRDVMILQHELIKVMRKVADDLESNGYPESERYSLFPNLETVRQTKIIVDF